MRAVFLHPPAPAGGVEGILGDGGDQRSRRRHRLPMVAAAPVWPTRTRSVPGPSCASHRRPRSPSTWCALTGWLLARLPAEGREILTKREEEVDEDGVVTRPPSSLTRRQVERLIALCKASQNPELGARVARAPDPPLRRSKTPAKFAKMLASHVDGVLYGQYVFNGAAQTGRASSRGVQMHNLARDTLPDEQAPSTRSPGGASMTTCSRRRIRWRASSRC